jgi:hypothetical protein
VALPADAAGWLLEERLRMVMRMDNVGLSATHLLDDNWEPIVDVPSARGTKSVNDELVRQWIRATVIEIAPQAETLLLTEASGNQSARYLKSEVGMNIVLPRGHIEELRLKITLSQTYGDAALPTLEEAGVDSIRRICAPDEAPAPEKP